VPRILLSADQPEDWLDYQRGSGKTIEITDLNVCSERRQGRGRALVKKLLNCLAPNTRVWAMTRRSNEIAQQFYVSMGFQVLGSLDGFYEPEGRTTDLALDQATSDAIVYGIIT
jgi:ribosomal protein S18 acetylase RimI-like enzyme